MIQTYSSKQFIKTQIIKKKYSMLCWGKKYICFGSTKGKQNRRQYLSMDAPTPIIYKMILHSNFFDCTIHKLLVSILTMDSIQRNYPIIVS